MGVLHVGLLAAQERRSHLHGARAEHEGRRHLPAVGDAAGRDDRHAHRVDDLRQEREQARLHADVDAGKRAAMAAGFGALRDDRVDAARFQRARLRHRGGAGDDEDPGALDGLHHAGCGKPKWKLTISGSARNSIARCSALTSLAAPFGSGTGPRPFAS